MCFCSEVIQKGFLLLSALTKRPKESDSSKDLTKHRYKKLNISKSISSWSCLQVRNGPISWLEPWNGVGFFFKVPCSDNWTARGTAVVTMSLILYLYISPTDYNVDSGSSDLISLFLVLCVCKSNCCQIFRDDRLTVKSFYWWKTGSGVNSRNNLVFRTKKNLELKLVPWVSLAFQKRF